MESSVCKLNPFSPFTFKFLPILLSKMDNNSDPKEELGSFEIDSPVPLSE